MSQVLVAAKASTEIFGNGSAVGIDDREKVADLVDLQFDEPEIGVKFQFALERTREEIRLDPDKPCLETARSVIIRIEEILRRRCVKAFQSVAEPLAYKNRPGLIRPLALHRGKTAKAENTADKGRDIDF